MKYFPNFLQKVLYTVVIFPLLFSCNNPLHNSHPSVDYNKVVEVANKVYDGGRYQEATHDLDSVTAYYHDLSIPQKFIYYQFNYNFAFHVKKDYSQAMIYADSLLYLFKLPENKIKFVAYYGRSLFFKGDVLFEENKYNEAYEYYYEGKLIGDKSLNDCTLSDYSYRMGMIMYKQEHFRLAAANFRNSSRESNTCELTFPSFYRRQEILNNAGLSYSKIDEPDSAMMFFKKALQYIDSQALKFDSKSELLDAARGVIYGNEANLYIQKNNFQIAKRLLKRSSEINLRKGNDNYDAELSELKLAHIYYRIGEVDSLYRLLGIVKQQLDTVKNQEAEKDYNSLMADYYIQNKDPGKALSYFIKYDALKDSLQAKKKTLKEADVSQQIKQLEKENEFNNLKRNNQSQDVYLKVGAVFGFMLLSIFLLIFLNWRKSRKNLKILGDLNHTINHQNSNLEDALEEIKLSSQEKDRILRTVAHDLRNPIGGIASLTQAMEDDDYTDEQKELISLIRETSNNSLELINEILEVTNNGPGQLKKELVEINSLVNKSVELLRFKAAEKNQTVIFEGLRLSKDLMISREKIWRVISNLISNAIKFSSAGGIITVKITEYANEIGISVRDTGIGIPDNMKNNIFNMFTEAKRPGTAGEKSFGLGLSISKQIIEDHSGKIWFESNFSKGTTFYIRLPDPKINGSFIPSKNQHKTVQMT